jgi:hypothetical protein
VVRVHKDHLVVLVGGVLAHPVGVQHAQALQPPANLVKEERTIQQYPGLGMIYSGTGLHCTFKVIPYRRTNYQCCLAGSRGTEIMICGSGSFLFIKDFPDPELQFGFVTRRSRSRNKYFRLRNSALWDCGSGTHFQSSLYGTERLT